MHSRFTNKYFIDSNGCYVYTGYINSDGYGKISYKGKYRYAHRVSKALFDGIELPDRKIKCLHSCDNPPCINPTHLWWGSQHENILDMIKKNRGNCGKGNTKLSLADVEEIKRLRLIGLSYQQIAEKFKITKKSAWNVIKGVTYKYGE